MTSLKRTSMLASALISATLLASPLAMADNHGDRGSHQGKPHHGDICEKMQQDDWEQRRQAMREKYNQRHDEIAERLELTEGQRQTWDQIRDERRQRYQERYETLRARCENNTGA